MDELIPVLIAAAFGALIWSSTSGRIRVLLRTATMVAIGVTATILSGEFAASWLYLLQDIAETAAGLACGVVILRWLTATSLSSAGVITVQRQSTEGDVGRRWPTLEKQLAAVHAPPGSSLAKVIADNQDFSILRPKEASDNLRSPP